MSKEIDRSSPAGKLNRSFLLYVGFGVAVFALVLVFGDVPRTLDALGSFDWRLVPAILALTTVNYGLRFLKWQYLLKRLGVPPFPRHRSLLVFLSAFSMTITPGKVGEWLKSVYLKRETGTPVSASAPIILVERLSDGLAMAVLATALVPFLGRGWEPMAGLYGVAILGLALLRVRVVTERGMRLLRRVPLLGRCSSSFDAFYASTCQMTGLGPMIVCIAIGIVSWACEGAAFALILYGLGAQISGTLLLAAIGVLATSTIAGVISMMPGGLAATEGSLAGLLLVLGLVGDGAVAAAATLLIRSMTLWFGVALGVVAVLALGFAPPPSVWLGRPAVKEPDAL